MSTNNVVTKLELIAGYKFNVISDVENLPNMLVDEAKPEGEGSGPNPTRLLATAVGHCLSSSLIFCLKKARITIKKLETTVTTNLLRNDIGRLRIKCINVQINLKVTTEDKSRVRRCLTIFEDYCTVTQSIRKGIEVNVDIQ